MNRNIFILGMRRSGTSILRMLINSNKDVEDILFEPHELFLAIQTVHIKRYSKIPYLNEAIDKFKNHTKWYGAKFALNVGIEAMNWKWLDDKFDIPFYVFIVRNPESTYNSWIKNETSLRGIVSYELYLPWYNHIVNSFKIFTDKNPNRSCLINYEDILSDVNKELNKISILLNIEPYQDMKHYITQPTN